MSDDSFKVRKRIKLDDNSSASDTQGEIRNNNGDLKFHDGSSEKSVVTDTATQTLTNKTIVAANNTITTAASGNLSATELDSALAELQTDIDTRATDSDLTTHTSATAAHGVSGSVVGTTDSQTLTNKTITSATVNTPTIDAITLDGQGSTPSNPASGDIKVYAKSADEKLYYLDSSGTERKVGSGSGGAGKQYFSDSNTEAASNFATFDDGAVSEPVDGTGGSPSTISVALKTSGQFWGENSSLEITKTAANGQGEGVSWDTDIALDDNVQAGEPLYIKFRYKTAAGYSTAGENIKVFYYRVGGTATGPFALNGYDGLGNYGNTLNHDDTGRGQFHGVVDADSTTTAIRVILMVDDTDTTAYTLEISDVHIESQAPVYNSFNTEYEDISITTTWDSWSTVTAKVRREGNIGHFDVKWSITSAGSLSGNLEITDLGGLTPDTSQYQMNVDNFAQIDGWTIVRDATVNSWLGPGQFLNSSGNIRPAILTDASTTLEGLANITPTVPHSFANTDTINFRFSMPITEWAGQSNVLSSTQMDFQNVVVELSSDDADAVPASITKFTFNNTVEDKLGTISSGTFTAPSSGTYEISGRFLTDSETWALDDNVVWTAYIDGVADKKIGQWRAASAATMRAYGEFSGTWDLTKGQTIEVYNQSAVATNLINDATHNFLLIKKVSQPTVVGAGMVPFELLKDTSSVKTPSATGHWHQHTDNSVTLTPGTWEVSGFINATESGSAGWTRIAAAFSESNGADSASSPTALGTNITRLDDGESIHLDNTNPGTINRYPVGPVIVTVTSSQAIYLNTYGTMTTAAQARVQVYINARRLK